MENLEATTMQITAWKCETTGKVFEHKVKYQSHLKKLAAERRSQAKHDAFELVQKQTFINMRNTVRSLPELKAFIEANWIHFCMNAEINNRWRFIKKSKSLIHPELKFFVVKDFRWNDEISNSHSCPIDGVKNWRGDNTMPDGSPAPRNYPGWKMSIEYQVVGQENTSTYPYSSEAWQGTGIHTGCGGYASNYYFQCDLFAADWPAMAEAYNATRTWAILNNDDRSLETIVRELYPA